MGYFQKVTTSHASKGCVFVVLRGAGHLKKSNGQVLWLDDYLNSWKKTLVVVSHDVGFLNKVIPPSIQQGCLAHKKVPLPGTLQ